MRFVTKLFKQDKGAAVTEYALLVALIAIAVIAAIILQRDQLIRLFTSVADVLGSV